MWSAAPVAPLWVQGTVPTAAAWPPHSIANATANTMFLFVPMKIGSISQLSVTECESVHGATPLLIAGTPARSAALE